MDRQSRSQHPNISNRQDEKHPFRVKVSGRKVNQNGIQHEGAFRPDTAKEITLQKELWQTFTGRYRNAEKKELQNGDLVWLEAKEPEKGIQTGADVESIQWARWGREGTSLSRCWRIDASTCVRTPFAMTDWSILLPISLAMSRFPKTGRRFIPHLPLEFVRKI